jgi:hypothetical protein
VKTEVFTLIPNFIGYCAVFKVRKEAFRPRRPELLRAKPPATSRSLKTQQHASNRLAPIGLGEIRLTAGVLTDASRSVPTLLAARRIKQVRSTYLSFRPNGVVANSG